MSVSSVGGGWDSGDSSGGGWDSGDSSGGGWDSGVSPGSESGQLPSGVDTGPDADAAVNDFVQETAPPLEKPITNADSGTSVQSRQPERAESALPNEAVVMRIALTGPKDEVKDLISSVRAVIFSRSDYVEVTNYQVSHDDALGS
jgi:hypothetical protein